MGTAFCEDTQEDSGKETGFPGTAFLLPRNASFLLLGFPSTSCNHCTPTSWLRPHVWTTGTLLCSSPVSPPEEGVSCAVSVGLIKSFVHARKGFAVPGWLEAVGNRCFPSNALSGDYRQPLHCPVVHLPQTGSNGTHGQRSPWGGSARGREGGKEEDNVGVTSGEDGGLQAPLLPYGSAVRTARPISLAGKYPHGSGRGQGLPSICSSQWL